MSDPKTQAKPADAAAKADQDESAAGAMSAAAAARKINGSITVFKRKDGEIVRSEKTGKPLVEKTAIKAEHIAAVGTTSAVTVDGKKHALA